MRKHTIEPQRGPRIFMTGAMCRKEEGEGSYGNANTTNPSTDTHIHLCHEISHRYTGTIQMPTAFMARYNNNVSTIQQV